MAASVARVSVDSVGALDAAITSYAAQGYVVINKTPRSVTMIKKKEFSVLWAVIGFLICVLPLLVYLIIYAAQSDQLVEITIAG
jgi:hypothetical protein